MRMKISEIKINPGRRDTQQRNVEELARSIAAVGLMNPITVTQDNTLIAGLHRLEAVKLLGWTEIECVVSKADGLQAELAEIDENFVRAGLSHRELGDLLLRRKELYEAIHPETRQGQRNGQTAKNANSSLLETKSFAQDTADKLGVSKRTVEQLVQTARDLTPEAKKTIRDAGDKITKGAALKISRLPPDQQEEAAAVLTIAPPAQKKSDTADLELLLKEFKANAQRFISGMAIFDRQADSFARMSYMQSDELWNSAVAVTDVIRAFSKKVNHIKDELQGERTNEN
ncbi:MAG: ParB N-terminal domain-containing protein [Oscillibacter sp.]|nr:ParB N-terminal domain-containing protein [Oscillibacter sp.]